MSFVAADSSLMVEGGPTHFECGSMNLQREIRLHSTPHFHSDMRFDALAHSQRLPPFETDWRPS